ncbi:MAG TPA: septal ring lytic transglycosylase RlpA family protein [Burkholderiaceae bacterium]|nr:septal ring lytic transglycosylase RlpA family protein [Burkholderiaceae bacterium]
MQLHIDLRCWQRYVVPCLLAALLIGCGSAPTSPPAAKHRSTQAPRDAARNMPVLPPAGSGRGGYYRDDGPGDRPMDKLLDTSDAEPKIEPHLPRLSRPYVVFGKTYTPITDNRPFKQRGTGSWYGKKFHGQKTASGELYDMYKMTAAHPTLPIPSYARVTNLRNGAQVIVRINDRGPFHSGRIIDVSYTAALKLGFLRSGNGQLEVERLLPDEIARITNDGRKTLKSRLAAGQNSGLPAPDTISRRANGSVMQAAVTANTDMPNAQVLALGQSGQSTDVLPTAAASGFYLQLGAYSKANNAEAMRARLSRKWSGNLPPIEVVPSGTLYRLYSGPFATRTDAVSAAQKMQDDGASEPLIVQR